MAPARGLISAWQLWPGEEDWAALLTRVARALTSTNNTGARVKVQISSERCQGHGRCYDLAPDLFGDDEEGYGQVLEDGTVTAALERDARLAAVNCPEHAIEVT